jgi:hypothetical protein
VRRQSENIDKAEEGLRELADYDDWDEPTENRVVVENHMHMHSEHDAETTPSELRKKPARLVQVVVGAAVAALLSWLSGLFGKR